MSYFNHAYKKTMLITDGVKVSGQTSATLTAGQIAIVTPSTYAAVNSSSNPDEYVIVQGNFNKPVALTAGNKTTYDALGNNKLHGGYAASVKSKMIKAKYVTKMWKVMNVDAQDVTSKICIVDECFTCANHAQMRIDLKGERVMRALNRNHYHVLDFTKCCTGADPTEPLAYDITKEWRDQINNDPILSQFISATASAGTTSCLEITLKQDDETEFSDCSMDTRDWYNTQPLTMTLTEVDDEGDACRTGCIKLANGTTDMPEIGQTVMVDQDYVSGESIIRDLIIDGSYRQDGGWNQGNRDSARFREIQKTNNLLAAVNRAGRYNVYYLQHSVPRFNNPTGMFDNDQYVVCIAVEAGSTHIAAMDTLWTNLAANVPGVSVVTY